MWLCLAVPERSDGETVSFLIYIWIHLILQMLKTLIWLVFKIFVAAGLVRFQSWDLAHLSCRPPIESQSVLKLHWISWPISVLDTTRKQRLLSVFKSPEKDKQEVTAIPAVAKETTVDVAAVAVFIRTVWHFTLKEGQKHHWRPSLVEKIISLSSWVFGKCRWAPQHRAAGHRALMCG